ncbi:hypothetical protein GCM10010275_02860 [Streptomyces litmocidini]|uniref:hypothetical protein n=1 Tax=Streptomyces litmocidini TaxID=67318 RepID=UPI00167EF473|nr:hypothetical protein [Streptomyces litmocidini]GGU71964.1 hypothetical protein GCM10010275_02860 [Streptomyces litmocidini]
MSRANRILATAGIAALLTAAGTASASAEVIGWDSAPRDGVIGWDSAPRDGVIGWDSATQDGVIGWD